ncbi:MAG: hypothetical protein ACFE9Q_12675 [Candidatus Hodarchaeota archaeon]
MYICKKKSFALTILLLVFIFPTFSISFSQNHPIISNFNTKYFSPKINQVSNFTVLSDIYKLIWIEGQLTLTLTANESGIIFCEFKDSNNGKYFSQINKTISLTGNNESQTFRLIFYPHLTTLPGRYNFILNINGIYNYSENFDIILGMGYIFLILIISIFGIGLVLILVKRKESLIKKPVSAPTEVETSSELDQVTSREINCPDCKMLIEEGLAFCPECGSRIPEFLRYRP